MVISEARLSSTLALTVTPPLLLIASTTAAVFGRTLSDGIYHRAFGPLVYVFFFGGLAYAFYEFAKVLMARTRYITYRDGSIHVLAHAPISLAQIHSVEVRRHLFLKNLEIKTSGGETVRIRGYLIQRDLNEVKRSIEMLQASEST